MSAEEVQRESMPVDVVIAGAGTSGLSAAIRLKQINPDLEESRNAKNYLGQIDGILPQLGCRA